MPVIQTIQLAGLLETGKVVVEMPLNSEVLLGVHVVQTTVMISIRFDMSIKLQVEREFVIIPNGTPYLDDLQFVGSIKLTDAKGIRFIHLLVGQQKSALSLAGLGKQVGAGGNGGA